MMRRLALLMLLPACVEVAAEQAVGQDIVGGAVASATEFPTVVALQRSGSTFCSGVLVHADWVLTTASCFDSTSATKIRIGDSNLNDGTINGLTIDVKAIHKHPQFSFDDAVWRHDVALLALDQPVTDRTPTPIRRDAVALGASVTQVGFGANTNSGGGVGVLRSLVTTVIDCAGAGDPGISNTNLLCFDASDGTGSCRGDGGAPAFVTTTSGRVVAGIASGGTASSCTSGLDVYTSLAPELAFIDSLIPPPMTPPTNPPANPPPGGNPDEGSGNGSGSGRNPGEEIDDKQSVRMVGCSAVGSRASLAVVLFAVLARLRRRGVRPAS